LKAENQTLKSEISELKASNSKLIAENAQFQEDNSLLELKFAKESAELTKAGTDLQAASELRGKYQKAAAAWKEKYDHQLERNVELQKENAAQAASLQEFAHGNELEELKSLAQAKKDPEIAEMLDMNVTKAEHHPPPEIDEVEETDVKMIEEPVELAAPVEPEVNEIVGEVNEEEDQHDEK
jgi:hypothetical protein